MHEHEPSRSQRSHYIWHIGVRQFGALFALGMLITDIWRHKWPLVPIGLSGRFALDVARELLVIATVSTAVGLLFGYFMWRFARWFLDVRD